MYPENNLLFGTADQLPELKKTPGLHKIEYSYNWNNKLDCRSYTTFRMCNPSKYQKGKRFAVYLKGKYHHDAEIIDVKTLLIGQLNEWIARIDSGYSLPKFVEVVKKMYKGKPINYDEQKWNLILFRRIDHEKDDE